MPCRWEASERPLLVRTVWIRGMRHALLTREELAKGGKSRSVSAKAEPCTTDATGVAERVCRWLAASRPLTPYGGSLWETPRCHSLDLKSNRASLSPKAPGQGPTCSPIEISLTEADEPQSQPIPSRPLVRTYPAPQSATSSKAINFQPPARPKLHIFMPDTRLPTEVALEDTDHFKQDYLNTYTDLMIS